jgi:cysteine desulfurase
VQAPGRIAMSFRQLKVATMALGGHKIHGPPGIGALLFRSDVRLRPLLRGGHQQEGRRGGTEPVALIVGFAAAVDLAVRQQSERAGKLERLRSAFVAQLQEALPDTLENGPQDPARRLPNTANLSFPGVPAQALLMALDMAGVCCSAGSACASGSALPSHVLVAMGLPADRVASAVRFSLHAEQTPAELAAAAAIVIASVRQVRAAFAGRAG